MRDDVVTAVADVADDRPVHEHPDDFTIAAHVTLFNAPAILPPATERLDHLPVALAIVGKIGRAHV